MAAAHKLVAIAWHMLKNNEPYPLCSALHLERKFDRLRRSGDQGAARKAVSPRDRLCPEKLLAKAVRAPFPLLSSVYAANGLPPIQALRPGEQSMLGAQTVWLDYATTSKCPASVPKALVQGLRSRSRLR